jgi:fructosamine-3-kinase
MNIDIDRLQTVLDEEILSVDLLTQGQIGPIYTLKTAGKTYLLKTSAPSERLPTEARMLGDINKYKIAVPKVFDVSDTHLLMAYIPTETVPKELQERRAADLLASLHSIGNDERMYGYWYDTTIGPFEQKNEQTQYNWALFLGQMRIMPMARICYDKGVLSKGMLDRLEVLCHTLYRRIDMSKITPSLLHGDLWSGNILFNMNGAVVIDPAIYFGDREMELAFILMFNTFGKTFFNAYEEVHPLSDGFYETKVPLYQIYPYLVHVALYGASYVPGLEEQLNRLKI